MSKSVKSFKLLGSKELKKQIASDTDDLLKMARGKKLKPVILIVGSTYLDSGTIHALSLDIQPFDWDRELELNKDLVIELYKERKLLFLEDCEMKGGLIGKDEDLGVIIYFDPDEEYLCLVCADGKTKGNKKDQVLTADGYSYFRVSFKPEETLLNFCIEKFN